MVKRLVGLIVLMATLATVGVHAAAPASPRGAFNVSCAFSHSRRDDPIVFPGLSRASHKHDFFGNKSTRYDSNYDTMIAAGTTCLLRDDKAGYWAPTAKLNGVRVVPKTVDAYYFGVQGLTVESLPPDLQMIAGNKDSPSGAENVRVGWFCGSNSSPVASHPYDCRPYAGQRSVDGVVAKADFPSCWDGQTPPRPFNTAYPTGRGVCPEGFPHLIPAVSLRFHFGFMDPCAGATPCTPADAPDANIKMTLSSGAYYSFHADLWNTWTQTRLDSLVDSCLNAHVKCGELRS
jgi:hypothetical protein